jgi:hypothetical protein
MKKNTKSLEPFNKKRACWNVIIESAKWPSRLNGTLGDPAQVKEAFVERNGQISVIK